MLGWLPSGQLLVLAGAVAILVVTLLPLGAWVMLGAGRFPLVAGLGWW